MNDINYGTRISTGALELNRDGLTLTIASIDNGTINAENTTGKNNLSKGDIFKEARIIIAKDKVDCSVEFIDNGTKEKEYLVFKINELKASQKVWELFNSPEFLNSSKAVDLKGSIASVPSIPRGDKTEVLEFMNKELGRSAEYISNTFLTNENVKNNIENYFGAIQIPAALVGPIHFNGQYANGMHYAVFATTEGALAASASRGAKAINEAGGIMTRVVKQRMTRAPVFEFENMHQGALFKKWLQDHFLIIKEEAEKHSNHAVLQEIIIELTGRQVHVVFSYTTGEAAGQNMTSLCTFHACNMILKQLEYLDQLDLIGFQLESNMSSDKKPSFRSLIHGRGIRVQAEIIIPKDIIEKKFRTTPQAMAEGYYRVITGAIESGMIGSCISPSNVVGAIFIATGQDEACIHESGVARVTMKMQGEDLYCEIILPNLVIGSIGGGTHLPTQREALEIMGCKTGTNDVFRLAEIIAGYALALELSTGSAMMSSEFVRAHESLGRNKPENSSNTKK